ncbi:MAG: hypothetical protein NWF08_01120 [Candidatus Bathyarchaeota archaeon]|nr:hypothetical protein [Candidatus Bathyarchaeota archaeon]
MKTIYSFIIGLIILILGLLAFIVSSGMLLSGSILETTLNIIPNVEALSVIVMVAGPVLFWLMIPLNNRYHMLSLKGKGEAKKVQEKQIRTKAEEAKGRTITTETKGTTLPPNRGELLQSAIKALELGDSKLAKEFVEQAKSVPGPEIEELPIETPEPSTVREEIEALRGRSEPIAIEEKFTTMPSSEVTIETVSTSKESKKTRKKKGKATKPKVQICIECGNEMVADAFYCDICGNFLRK